MLEALLDRKGALSRQIGQAKRSNLSIDELLEEMKQISGQIKVLKDGAKVENKAASDNQNSDGRKTLDIPPLFGDLPESDLPSDLRVEIVQANDQKHSAAWDQYVESKVNSSIYQMWEFKNIIESSFGHKCRYLIALDSSSNKIVGVLPSVEMKSRLFGHFLVTQPFFTYGSVLSDNEEIEVSLHSALIASAKESGIEHIEFRGTRSSNPLKKQLSEKTSKVSMVRPLPEDADTLWREIGTKVRAQIKKSQRFPLKIEFGKTELLDDFYRVFSENMRDLGTPVYSKHFFANLLNSTLASSFTVGVVYHEKKPVAACFLMSHKSMMEIPWASTLKSVNSMNVNMFMYWEVLSMAVSSKHDFFDFGRSSKDANTYRFKKQWGARPHQLYWRYWLPDGQELPELNPNNPKYKLMIQIWQKLPIWLTQIIGPPVVKYLP